MKTIRNKLKNIPFIYTINAGIKTYNCKLHYKSICKYYDEIARQKELLYDESAVSNQASDILTSRNIIPDEISNEELCILYVGTNEWQDKTGFLQSLQKFGHICYFTQSDGTYGQHSTNRTANGHRLLELVKNIQAERPLHIVLGQMWNYKMPWQVLDIIRKMGIITVNICMDDRHAFHRSKINGEWSGTCGLIPGLDFALTAAPEACLWYAVEGLPAIFWPEASDPDFFKPMDHSKIYDVCFIGANYGIRRKIVKAIEKEGIKVDCYGLDWPNGRINIEDTPELFAKSKIILGVGSIGYCKDFYSLKMRDFDGPMSGSLYLTHDNPDLYKLYNIGKEIVTYKSVKDCVEKVKYYLEHPDLAEEIGRAGRMRAEKEHTWEKRFEKLFCTLGIAAKVEKEKYVKA